MPRSPRRSPNSSAPPSARSPAGPDPGADLQGLAESLAVLFPDDFARLVETHNQWDRQDSRYSPYRDRPGAFARDLLQFEFTPAQERMAGSLLEPPYRTLVPSANEQGKTAGAAALVLWWICTRRPVVIPTTAPRYQQVRDLLWKEIRRLAGRLPYPLPFLPKSCRIERGPDDFAEGTTARDATAFQGHHGPNQLFVFDESTGVDAEFFEAVEGMFSPPGHAWLCLFNPTTTSSHVYLEYSRVESAGRTGSPAGWHVVRMSALDHPNIAAELRGEPPPVPHAMRAEKFERLLRQWSTLSAADPARAIGSEGGPEPGDVVWPPLDAAAYIERTGQVPRVYRPGPEAESRLLARFPSSGSNAVWGDGDWLAALRQLPGMGPLTWRQNTLPEIGCDVARFGDDQTEIHVRCGPVSLWHESASKRPTDQTAGRLAELASEWADWFNREKEHLFRPVLPQQIPIKIDDTGVGGGVVDILRGRGYNAVAVNAAECANDEERYPSRRDELWFALAERARRGELDLSRLDGGTLDELRRQAVTALWSLDSDARRVVRPKVKAKSELGRSPDGMDAVNLAYYVVSGTGPGVSTTWRRADPLGM